MVIGSEEYSSRFGKQKNSAAVASARISTSQGFLHAEHSDTQLRAGLE